MKRSMTVLIALAVLAVGGAAWADITTVDVSATVTGVCKFQSNGSISFTLDPSVGGDVNGNVTQPTFWCTKGAGYTIDDDLGNNEAVSGTAPRRMKHASLDEWIPYSFAYSASGTGNGPTSTLTMDITSTVVSASYLSASAGSYTDLVTLTITP